MRTLLTALTALMLFATPVVAGDWDWKDWVDGWTAYHAGDYQKAFRLWKPLAEQGLAKAQYSIGLMYGQAKGVPENFVAAYAWTNIAAAQGNEGAKKNKGIVKSEAVLHILFFARSSSVRHSVRSYVLPRFPDTVVRLALSVF